MEKNSTTQSLLHRRLLSAGLLAGVSVVATAGAAAAVPVTTVEAGTRTPVVQETATVSPAALPVTWETSDRRTTFVDVVL